MFAHFHEEIITAICLQAIYLFHTLECCRVYTVFITLIKNFPESTCTSQQSRDTVLSLIPSLMAGSSVFFLCSVSFLLCLPLQILAAQRNEGGQPGPEKRRNGKKVIYSQAFPRNVMNKFSQVSIYTWLFDCSVLSLWGNKKMEVKDVDCSHCGNVWLTVREHLFIIYFFN